VLFLLVNFWVRVKFSVTCFLYCLGENLLLKMHVFKISYTQCFICFQSFFKFPLMIGKCSYNLMVKYILWLETIIYDSEDFVVFMYYYYMQTYLLVTFDQLQNIIYKFKPLSLLSMLMKDNQTVHKVYLDSWICETSATV